MSRAELNIDAYRSNKAQITSRHAMLRLALDHHRYNDEPTGGALSFLDMPFLVQIYRDLLTCRELVAKKCTQVGYTEAGMLFGVAQAGLRGRRHALVLPDEDVARTFVQDRVQPLLDRVPYYRELRNASHRTKSADNVKLIHLGRGSWRFVGTNKPAKLREFPADSMLVDEVDECNATNLPLVKDRVRNSQNPQLIYFGNPRRTEGGISRMFLGSDQREWFHQCPRCNERQRIDWFKNVIDRDDSGRWVPRDKARASGLSHADPAPGRIVDIRPVCIRCGRPWDRQREGCSWVTMNPGVARRGYHLSRMDHLNQRLWALYLEWMAAQGDLSEIAAFYTGALGEAHEGAEGRLTNEDLEGAITSRPMDRVGGPSYLRQTVVCGVDVGAVLNVKISVVTPTPLDPADESAGIYQRRDKAYVGFANDFDELKDLVKRYRMNVICVDAEPEHLGAQAFQRWVHAHTPAQCWLVRYHPTDKLTDLEYGMKLKPEICEVQVDKTQVMDATLADIRQGRTSYPEDTQLVLGWADQMKAPIRKLVTNSRGRERYSWERGSKRDDFRQAECYERIASDLFLLSGGVFDIQL